MTAHEVLWTCEPWPKGMRSHSWAGVVCEQHSTVGKTFEDAVNGIILAAAEIAMSKNCNAMVNLAIEYDPFDQLIRIHAVAACVEPLEVAA